MNTTQKYHALTLKQHNQYRLNFLPCFPIPFPPRSLLSTSGNHQKAPESGSKLLLSSVPVQCLSDQQLQRRQFGVFQRPFEYKILGNHPSFLNSTYQYLYQHLSERLHVDPAIIDFNLARLDEVMSTLAMNNDQQYWTDEQQRTREERDIALDFTQIAMTLEIFLQTDVDMLYMKTCSYRGANPRLIDIDCKEGIFCVNPPEARYGFMPCNHEHCRCCSDHGHLTRRPEPAVTFYSSYYHTFLNGYQVILNCPAMCTTTNVIYVLTCPCRQFEYIGETKMAFSDRLSRHHQHGTRIMYEFLIGKTIVNYTLTEPKSMETLAKDRMRLYRHSTCCSTAMQMFLICNPQYWCFVPMKEMDADFDDIAYVPTCSPIINILSEYHINENSLNDLPLSPSATSAIDVRNGEETQWMVDNLPVPPSGYRFTRRQRFEQYQFFQNKQDLYAPPSSHLDLYNATIVFVLPNKCSDFVRRFIESLLITHAECQLNTAGRLTAIARVDTNNNPDFDPSTHVVWCEKLVHPSPSPIV